MACAYKDLYVYEHLRPIPPSATSNKGRTNEQTNETNGRTDGRTNERTNEISRDLHYILWSSARLNLAKGIRISVI